MFYVIMQYGSSYSVYDAVHLTTGQGAWPNPTFPDTPIQSEKLANKIRRNYKGSKVVTQQEYEQDYVGGAKPLIPLPPMQ